MKHAQKTPRSVNSDLDKHDEQQRRLQQEARELVKSQELLKEAAQLARRKCIQQQEQTQRQAQRQAQSQAQSQPLSTAGPASPLSTAGPAGLLTINQLIRKLPVKVHKCTIKRWIKHGLQIPANRNHKAKTTPKPAAGETQTHTKPAAGAVKLAAGVVGNTYYTTLKNYQDFVDEINRRRCS